MGRAYPQGDEITPAQHGFLSALDRFLRARTTAEQREAQLAMKVMGDLIRHEAGIPPLGSSARDSSEAARRRPKAA